MIRMTALKRTSSRQERLAKAEKLSNLISESAAGLSYPQIEKDVKKIFKNIKASRRSDSN